MAFTTLMKTQEKIQPFSTKCVYVFTAPGQNNLFDSLTKTIANTTSESLYNYSIHRALLDKQEALQALSVFHPPPMADACCF